MAPHYLQRQLYIVSFWSSIQAFIITGLLSTRRSRKTCYTARDLRFLCYQHQPHPKFSWTGISGTLCVCGGYCEHPISCIATRGWHCWYWSKATRSTPRGGHRILTSLTSTKPVESSERTDFETFLGIWLVFTSVICTSGWMHEGFSQEDQMKTTTTTQMHFYIAPSRNFECNHFVLHMYSFNRSQYKLYCDIKLHPSK